MYQQSRWEIINFSSKNRTRIYQSQTNETKANQEVSCLAVHTLAYDALEQNDTLQRTWHQKYLFFQGASKLRASFNKGININGVKPWILRWKDKRVGKNKDKLGKSNDNFLQNLS